MDLIFLDVDGVLNSTKHALELYKKTGVQRSNERYPFDWECLENFYKLVSDTDASVVISSSWRNYEKNMHVLNQIFDFYGIRDKIVGQTGVMWNHGRDREIMDYLYRNPCDHFVVLDDVMYTSLMDYTVWTTLYEGFTKDDVEKAKKILKKEHKFKG